MYDDTEYHMLDKDNVVQLSSIIHQNIYMFDETIYDNICLHEHYPEERIDYYISLAAIALEYDLTMNGFYFAREIDGMRDNMTELERGEAKSENIYVFCPNK